MNDLYMGNYKAWAKEMENINEWGGWPMFMDYNCSWGQWVVSVGKDATPDNLGLIGLSWIDTQDCHGRRELTPSPPFSTWARPRRPQNNEIRKCYKN